MKAITPRINVSESDLHAMREAKKAGLTACGLHRIEGKKYSVHIITAVTYACILRMHLGEETLTWITYDYSTEAWKEIA